MQDNALLLLAAIKQCGMSAARGAVMPISENGQFIAAKIVNGVPVDIAYFDTKPEAESHALG